VLAVQTFMIANHCNLACTYCWYETGASDYTSNTLGSATYDAWLQRCAETAPVREVNFTGGEPLLREDFADLLGIAAARAQRTAVFTNGVPLTRVTAQLLAAVGTEVHLSLDHISPQLDDRVRGGTKATLRGLDLLLAAGVRKIQMCMVLTSRNWTDVGTVMARARDQNLDVELMAVALPDAHPLSLRTLAVGELARLSDVIQANGDLLGRPSYYQRLRRYLLTGQLRPRPGCAAAERGVFINSDGAIWLCPQRSGVSLGNITTADPADVLQRKAAEAATRTPGRCVSLDCLVLT
jgi:molybdenum cofactor biosynthesis enzyme MoaA